MAALCLAGFAVSALFSLGLLIRKDRSPEAVTMAFLLLAVAVILGTAAFRYRADPFLERPPVPYLAPLIVLGLMIHRLSLQTVRLKTERKRAGLAFAALIPPALVSDILVHGFRLHENGAAAWVMVPAGLHIFTGVSVAALCCAAIARVFRNYAPSSMTGLAWAALAVSGSSFIALSAGLTGLFLGNARMYGVLEGFTVGAVVLGALAYFRWPGILGRFREETVTRRYARSLLAGMDVEGLIGGMKEMVARTGIYRSASCTLDELARRMGLSRHQTSELLNDRMGTSYPAFINDFRVEEAKELLRIKPEMTVLEIALEVGFGNKTSFNDAFRGAEGVPPTEFRKKRAVPRQER